MASDGKGVVYVANSATNTIWRLKDGKFEAWLTDEALNAPNGLHVEGDTLLVAPFGAMAEAGKEAKLANLLVVSLNDKSIKQLGIGLAFGNLDGVEPIEPGVYLVTDWASGPLYRVDAQGNVVRLARSASGDGRPDLSPRDQDDPHPDDAGQRARCLQIGVGASKFLWIGLSIGGRAA